MTATPFTATVTGSPRIGPKRELKRATEGYWAGRTSRADLEKVAATIRHDTWAQLAAAVLNDGSTIRRTIDFNKGDLPIPEALATSGDR